MKHRQFILAILALLLLFCSGCATEAKFRDMLISYENRPISSVIKAWGIPSGKYQDGNRTYYTWNKSQQRNIPIYTPNTSTSQHSGNVGPYSYSGTTTTYGGSYQNLQVNDWCEVTLVTNESDRIIDWSYRGNACVAK